MKTTIDTKRKWWPEVSQTIRCRCGTIFRGRAKFTYVNGVPTKVVDRPCPGCDNLNVVSTESDPESWNIKG